MQNFATTVNNSTKKILTQAEIEKLCTVGHANVNECIVQDCSVCLGEVNNKCLHRTLPCKHAFHPHCIDKWLLESSDSCPICRCKVKNEVKVETPIQVNDNRIAFDNRIVFDNRIEILSMMYI